ncbi:hypothetical protein VTK26DRAFT_8182 [Humicola hyalothermophila]
MGMRCLNTRPTAPGKMMQWQRSAVWDGVGRDSVSTATRQLPVPPRDALFARAVSRASLRRSNRSRQAADVFLLATSSASFHNSVRTGREMHILRSREERLQNGRSSLFIQPGTGLQVTLNHQGGQDSDSYSRTSREIRRMYHKRTLPPSEPPPVHTANLADSIATQASTHGALAKEKRIEQAVVAPTAPLLLLLAAIEDTHMSRQHVQIPLPDQPTKQVVLSHCH